jgi:hypothetical protein
VDAVTYFARGLGSALRGDPTAAAEDAEKLGQLRDALLASKDTYWAEQVAIQQLEATAWVALDEGRSSEALTTLRSRHSAIRPRSSKSSISPTSVRQRPAKW